VPSADRKWATNSTTPVASSGPPSWVCRMRSRRHVIPDGAVAWVGRVAGCQLAATYSESSSTNAVYRDRISASAVDGVAVPDKNGPQHCRSVSPVPHGQGCSAVCTGIALLRYSRRLGQHFLPDQFSLDPPMNNVVVSAF